jgi:hypothetical protein
MNVTDQIILDGITNIFTQCRKQVIHEEFKNLKVIDAIILKEIEKFEKELDYGNLKEAYKKAYDFLWYIADDCVTLINRHDCMCATIEVYHPEGVYELVYGDD